jgi:hypothetical protein
MYLRRLPSYFLVAAAVLLIGFVKSGSAKINAQLDVLNKCVVFIYAADSSGLNPNPSAPLGTAFIVQVPHVSNPEIAYTMLVTARHIVDPQWAQCPGQNPARIFLRLNTKNYDPSTDGTGIGFIAVDLAEAGQAIWAHDASDENVDVALIPIKFSELEKFDWASIKISEFATDDELKARAPSDPVASVGLLPAYAGVKRNYPVLKLGYISNEPDELVSVQCVPNGVNRLLRVWLLSINLVPGNSGAPILYVPEGSNGVSFGGSRVNVIGLQSISFLGSEVAGMTPSRYIFESIQALNLPDADLYRGAPANKPAKN